MIDLERLKTLAGINEAKEPEIEKIKYAHEPTNMFDLKVVAPQDDFDKHQAEVSGMDIVADEKVKVPSSVKKAVNTRIAELKDSMEKFGGGGPKETALEQLEKIKELLDSGNLMDYREAQLLYGTLWNEISELFPTALVSFLHTGKELENTPIQ